MEVLNGEIGSFLEQKAQESNRADLLYGFADATNVAVVEEDGTALNRAISIACALDPASVASLSSGVTREYRDECDAAVEFLDALSLELIEDLRAKGYHAASLGDPSLKVRLLSQKHESDVYENASSPLFPTHRVFAAHAGLGWVGKNGLIITKHYGPAVMLATVFTDAPLDCARQVFLSRCGRCQECAEACPVDAIKISNRASLDEVESMVDLDLCAEECHRQTLAHFGEAIDVCGICIYACPYTKSYLRRKGHPYE